MLYEHRNLNSRLDIQVEGEKVNIDPKVLFQRLFLIGMNTGLHIHTLFSYELCSYPPALFDAHGYMRVGDKSALFTALVKQDSSHPPSTHASSSHPDHVVDCGLLLHKVPWPQNATYGDIVKLYVKYAHRHYGANGTTVVTDRYNRQQAWLPDKDLSSFYQYGRAGLPPQPDNCIVGVV